MVEQVDGDMTERVDTVLHDTVLYQTDSGDLSDWVHNLQLCT